MRLVPDNDRVVETTNQNKVLGLKWDVSTDTLYFDLQLNVCDKVMRRSMLSTVSSLFDPVGLATPVVYNHRGTGTVKKPLKNPEKPLKISQKHLKRPQF